MFYIFQYEEIKTWTAYVTKKTRLRICKKKTYMQMHSSFANNFLRFVAILLVRVTRNLVVFENSRAACHQLHTRTLTKTILESLKKKFSSTKESNLGSRYVTVLYCESCTFSDRDAGPVTPEWAVNDACMPTFDTKNSFSVIRLKKEINS